MNPPNVLNVAAVLETSPLLSVLTPEEKDALASQCRLARAQKGEPIWVRAADADFVGLLGAGFVKMVRPSSAGAEMTLEIMGPGQVFGLLGAIEGTGCPLMAYALTQAVYLRIPKRAIEPIYHANHELKDRIIRRTAARLHQKHDFMSKLSTGKAEVRLAALLLILAQSYGEPEDGAIRLQLPLTRQEIGEMTGLTTETVIRVLSKWGQEGLVETDRQHLLLRRPAGLEGLLG